ncbi:MAG: type 2 isopentenyl-diphosphate Delta-isomerase [Rickettsia sp.]|nr:type 2 isopentenyl-diphosphate Delta-isomerase [Rickettsia sp.]
MINNRKFEHINILTSKNEIDKSSQYKYFDQIKLINRALPELDLSEIDTSIDFLGYKLSMPLIISSMTGGKGKIFTTINQNLAIAAAKTNVAFSVGSQRIMKYEPLANKSFDIKNITKNIPVISNLGAVQLNYELNLKDIEYFSDFINADGIYFHCNPLQEAIQLEGNTNFKNIISKISDISNNIKLPIILKEVGCGISTYDIELGLKNGIKYFDLSGSGGTSWSLVEYIRSSRNSKSQNQSLGYNFQDWGIPTLKALQDSKKYRNQALFIASGGIRNGIDIAKSIILGASLVGIAKPFLHAAQKSSEEVIELIQFLQKELKISMFLMGIKNLSELFGNESLILKNN